MRVMTYLLALLALEVQIHLIATEIVGSRCDSKVGDCAKWEWHSAWEQGGYWASCKKEGYGHTSRQRIFLVRNIYKCPGSNSSKNRRKIVNTYSDANGNHCRLLRGDDNCPGITNSTKVRKRRLNLALLCGDVKCKTRYHRCDFCEVSPWYTWIPRNIAGKIKRRIRCKSLFIISKLTKRYNNDICLRCDGTEVSPNYCAAARNTYFVDFSSTKPSWSEWMQSSECQTETNRLPECGNRTYVGHVTWTKECQYPNHPLIKIESKYCGKKNNVTVQCKVKTISCEGNGPVAPYVHRNTKSHDANTWAAIIIVSLLGFVLIVLLAYLKYREVQFKSVGEHKPLRKTLCQSCSTQTSPRYSPRRIITEPEYALIGNLRRNITEETPQKDAEYCFAAESSYPLVPRRLSDDCISDSNEEVVSSSDAPQRSKSTATEASDARLSIEADEKRAIYAKVDKRRTQS